MTTRREFLSGLAAAGLGSQPMFREHAIRSLFRANAIAGDRPPHAVADDEAYWAEIQRAFDLDRTMINLNNGGCSPTPSHVLEQMIRDLRFSNELPVEHMWRVLEPRIESVRRDLAQRVRLRSGGDGDHPQRVRGERDDDLRPRPQARRRGRRHEPELRPHAHRVGPARAARRDRAQAGDVQGAAAVARSTSSTSSRRRSRRARASSRSRTSPT